VPLPKRLQLSRHWAGLQPNALIFCHELKKVIEMKKPNEDFSGHEGADACLMRVGTHPPSPLGPFHTLQM